MIVAPLVVISNNTVMGVMSNIIRVWDSIPSKNFYDLQGHNDYVTHLSTLSTDKIVSASYDRTVRIWDIKSRSNIYTFKGPNEITHLSVLGNKVIIGGNIDKYGFNHNIWIWDPEEKQYFERKQEDAIDNIYHLSDSVILISLRNGIIKTWDINKDMIISTLHLENGHCLAVLPSNRIAVSTSNNRIKIWNLISKEKEITLFGHMNKITYMTLLSNGNLATLSINGEYKVWDIKNGTCLLQRLKQFKSFIPLTDNKLILSKEVFYLDEDVYVEIEENAQIHSAVLINDMLIASMCDEEVVIYKMCE